jgi:hypothetical protein
MENEDADAEDILIAVDHLAEAEQSELMADLPYVVLGLSPSFGIDDPYLL